MGTDNEPGVRDLLNGQTAKLAWPELQRHFARGVVLRVAGGLDLVEAAARLVEDDKQAIEGWMDAGLFAKATLDDARRWEAEQTGFWAVVTAPWVLVQELDDSPQQNPEH